MGVAAGAAAPLYTCAVNGRAVLARLGGGCAARGTNAPAGHREGWFYRRTPGGGRVLAGQQETWKAYVAAVNGVMGSTT